MPFPFKISAVGLGVFTTVLVTPSSAWNYSNTAWTTGNCSAQYSAQSPINVAVAAVVEASAQTPPQEFNFDWEGFPDSATESAIEGGLVLNNHTVELNWDINDAATNKYGMTVGDKLYRLRQFHFHSPSEHTVDGQHYDMEAHHVHFCEGVSCETEDPNDEILVVALMIRAGSANSYLDSFWGLLPNAGHSEPAISGLANPYTSFMPSDKSYYSYVGSTTTPPCARNVQWRLLQQHVEMSQLQLTAYHESVNGLTQPALQSEPPQGVSPGWTADTKTNNRPVQEVGDRIVVHFVAPPQPAAVDASEPAAAAAEPAAAESSFPVMRLLVALAAVALLTAAVCLFLNWKNKAPTAKRALKPKPPAATEAAPKEEVVPLMPPPVLSAPNLSMVVPAQPLMQAVPQAYTTAVRPMAVAPYGQAPVVLQP